MNISCRNNTDLIIILIQIFLFIESNTQNVIANNMFCNHKCLKSFKNVVQKNLYGREEKKIKKEREK